MYELIYSYRITFRDHCQGLLIIKVMLTVLEIHRTIYSHINKYMNVWIHMFSQKVTLL